MKNHFCTIWWTCTYQMTYFLLKVGQFATPMTSCKNWLSPVYSCTYCVRQTCDIYEVRPYSVDFKAPGGFEILWVRQYLANVDLIGIKDLWFSEMNVKLKGHLHVGSGNIFPILYPGIICYNLNHIWRGSTIIPSQYTPDTLWGLQAMFYKNNHWLANICEIH